MKRPLIPTTHDGYRTRWAAHFAEARASGDKIPARLRSMELDQLFYRRAQVIQWRFACAEASAIGKNGPSLEKLRKRFTADQELYLDDEGRAEPGDQISIDYLRESEEVWWGRARR